MTGGRWKRVEEVFEAAVEMPEAERPVFLDSACSGDDELRREVEAMLSADPAFGGVVRSALAEHAAGLAASGEALVGKRIGAWRLAKVLGYGGTGTVFLAERDDQAFYKRAAIKLIKRGMETAVVLQHFRRERQILARLDHPYIARLIDGGSTEEGTPYFVMEYVDGMPITTYCEAHHLSVSQRLRLFCDVCAAVQFAHQNLVVHRDLKPGNVFVRKDGTPKLLDFGVAKLLQPDLETETVTNVRMLTPDYASPEQVRGEPVTTATDVYSLGVVLYEMLAGRRPYETKTVSWVELEKKICQSKPDSPAALVPALRGDIENIVLQALRKEPERRYSSAEQFAEDIRRHLAGLPVRARKDTLVYRTGKFLRRNRWPMAAGSLATIGLIVATTVALWQAGRAERQLHAVRALAMTMLIDVNDKFRVLPGSIEGRKLMVEKGLGYLDQIGREGRQDASILWDLARGYEKIASLQASPDPAEPMLFDFAHGVENYYRALSLAEHVERLRGRDTESLLLLCRIRVAIGGISQRRDEAESQLNQALSLIAGLPPNFSRKWEPDGPDIGQYLHDQAYIFLARWVLESDPAKALEYYRKTWPQFAGVYSIMALDRMGDIEQALEAARAYGQGQKEGALRHSTEDILMRIGRTATAGALSLAASDLGNPFQMNIGNTAAALSASSQAMELIDANLSRDATDPFALNLKLGVLATRGAILSDKDPAASVKAYSEVLAAKLEPWSYPEVADARWQIAYPLSKLGKRLEALQYAEKSLVDRPTANAHIAAADVLTELGRRETALGHYQSAVAEAEKRAAELPKNMMVRAGLGRAYEHFGRYYEANADGRAAMEWLSKAHNVWEKWHESGGTSNPFVLRKQRELAQALGRARTVKPSAK